MLCAVFQALFFWRNWNAQMSLWGAVHFFHFRLLFSSVSCSITWIHHTSCSWTFGFFPVSWCYKRCCLKHLYSHARCNCILVHTFSRKGIARVWDMWMFNLANNSALSYRGCTTLKKTLWTIFCLMLTFICFSPYSISLP